MTSHSEDEAFDHFIEVMDSDGSDDLSEKENKENNISMDNVKTKIEQIDKIIAFVKKHNEELIGKVKYSLLWESLVGDLNAMGPPTNSVEKWKRIWSVYKYNNRKRLPQILGRGSASYREELSHSSAQHSIPILVDNSNAHTLGQHSTPILVDNSNAHTLVQHSTPILVDDSNAGEQGFESEVLKQLSLVTVQQKIIIQKLDQQNALLEKNSKQN